jgi:hypothetical protein
MSSFAIPGESAVEIRDSRERTALSASVTVAGRWVDTARHVLARSVEADRSGVAHGAGCVVPFRGNLPGPSRRIVVEPIEVPAQPVQVPTGPPVEPVELPGDEPVPAR